MESIELLTKEINDTFASIHDLVKWKLAVCAALGAAALGLNVSGDNRHPYYLLLLLIPLVCVYVDLYTYQYQIRILVIAQFLRHQTTDAVLKEYELWCVTVRKHGDFGLWHFAGAGATAVMSLGSVVVVWTQYYRKGTWMNLVFAAFLMVVAGTVISLSMNYDSRATLLDQESESKAMAKAAATQK